METHKAVLIVLTALAAVGGIAGVWLLVWTWIDRPQHAWNVRIKPGLRKQVRSRDGSLRDDLADKSERHKATIEVQPIGTAIAHNVQVNVRGAHPFNASNGLRELHMTALSDPITFDVHIPAAAEGRDVYVEFTWIQVRPHRHKGQRIELRTQRWEYWRWTWRSLKRRGWRFIRTDGRWVAREGVECPRYPRPRIKRDIRRRRPRLSRPGSRRSLGWE